MVFFSPSFISVGYYEDILRIFSFLILELHIYAIKDILFFWGGGGGRD